MPDHRTMQLLMRNSTLENFLTEQNELRGQVYTPRGQMRSRSGDTADRFCWCPKWEFSARLEVHIDGLRMGLAPESTIRAPERDGRWREQPCLRDSRDWRGNEGQLRRQRAFGGKREAAQIPPRWANKERAADSPWTMLGWVSSWSLTGSGKMMAVSLRFINSWIFMSSFLGGLMGHTSSWVLSELESLPSFFTWASEEMSPIHTKEGSKSWHCLSLKRLFCKSRLYTMNALTLFCTRNICLYHSRFSHVWHIICNVVAVKTIQMDVCFQLYVAAAAVIAALVTILLLTLVARVVVGRRGWVLLLCHSLNTCVIINCKRSNKTIVKMSQFYFMPLYISITKAVINQLMNLTCTGHWLDSHKNPIKLFCHLPICYSWFIQFRQLYWRVYPPKGTECYGTGCIYHSHSWMEKEQDLADSICDFTGTIRVFQCLSHASVFNWPYISYSEVICNKRGWCLPMVISQNEANSISFRGTDWLYSTINIPTLEVYI